MSWRSLLYVPAHSARFVRKAHERGADAIILDLEDAVPAGDKAGARAALAEAVPAVGRNGAAVFVRINSEPEWRDLDAAAAAAATPAGLIVPKAIDPAAVARIGERFELDIIALIEDPGAVLDARAIAKIPRVIGLTTGSEDLSLTLGAEPLPDVLRVPKLLVHYAAKAEGKLSFGTLRSIADYSNLEAIAEAAREARSHGFDGAMCVHPSAVRVLNAGFVPDEKQVAWARRVVEMAASGAAAFELDGKMVDIPVIRRAQALLDRLR